jgi:hypothetical protein
MDSFANQKRNSFPQAKALMASQVFCNLQDIIFNFQGGSHVIIIASAHLDVNLLLSIESPSECAGASIKACCRPWPSSGIEEVTEEG